MQHFSFVYVLYGGDGGGEQLYGNPFKVAIQINVTLFFGIRF